MNVKNIIFFIIIDLTSSFTEDSQSNNRENLTKDYKDLKIYTSKADLESAAKENNPEPISFLGSMYATGEGTEVGAKKGIPQLYIMLV